MGREDGMVQGGVREVGLTVEGLGLVREQLARAANRVQDALVAEAGKGRVEGGPLMRHAYDLAYLDQQLAGVSCLLAKAERGEDVMEAARSMRDCFVRRALDGVDAQHDGPAGLAAEAGASAMKALAGALSLALGRGEG